MSALGSKTLSLTTVVPAQPRFSMASTQVTPSDSVHQGKPIWFVIGSTLDNSLELLHEQSSVEFEELKRSLRRQVDVLPERTIEKLEKSVSFQTSVSTASIPSHKMQGFSCTAAVWWTAQFSCRGPALRYSTQ